MAMCCNIGVVIVDEVEVREVVTSNGVKRVALGMVQLAFAADLMGFLVAIADDRDFSAQRVIHIYAPDGQGDGPRFP